VHRKCKYLKIHSALIFALNRAADITKKGSLVHVAFACAGTALGFMYATVMGTTREQGTSPKVAKYRYNRKEIK
jgi:hypothetical protein